MKNALGVPVPGWTLLATGFGGALVVLSVVAAVLGDFALILLLVVGPVALLGVALSIWAQVELAESRRQTAVVRAVFGYGLGEIPASWRWHGWRIAFFSVSTAWYGGLALADSSGVSCLGAACFGLNWLVFTVSAVQKWRNERRPRGVFPRPERVATPPATLPPRPLPPKPVRGA